MNFDLVIAIRALAADRWMSRKTSIDNQLSWVSFFTQLLKQPCGQANGLSFHTGLATATAALAAVITTSFIGLMGHFNSLQRGYE
jgi:hypothetical protein